MFNQVLKYEPWSLRDLLNVLFHIFDRLFVDDVPAVCIIGEL